MLLTYDVESVRPVVLRDVSPAAAPRPVLPGPLLPAPGGAAPASRPGSGATPSRAAAARRRGSRRRGPCPGAGGVARPRSVRAVSLLRVRLLLVLPQVIVDVVSVGRLAHVTGSGRFPVVEHFRLFTTATVVVVVAG